VRSILILVARGRGDPATQVPCILRRGRDWGVDLQRRSCVWRWRHIAGNVCAARIRGGNTTRGLYAEGVGDQRGDVLPGGNGSSLIYIPRGGESVRKSNALVSQESYIARTLPNEPSVSNERLLPQLFHDVQNKVPFILFLSLLYLTFMSEIYPCS
jgi:hypothetical protein